MPAVIPKVVKGVPDTLAMIIFPSAVEPLDSDKLLAYISSFPFTTAAVTPSIVAALIAADT